MPTSHPKFTLLLGLLIVIVAGGGLPALKVSNNQRIFFSDDDPNLAAFNAFENTFGRVDNLLFALVPPGDNVYTQEFLSTLATLTDAAWQLPFAGRVQSLTNFQHSEARADDLIIKDLVHEPSSLNADDLESIRDYVRTEEYLYKTLVNAEGTVAGGLLPCGYRAPTIRKKCRRSWRLLQDSLTSSKVVTPAWKFV